MKLTLKKLKKKKLKKQKKKKKKKLLFELDVFAMIFHDEIWDSSFSNLKKTLLKKKEDEE